MHKFHYREAIKSRARFLYKKYRTLAFFAKESLSGNAEIREKMKNRTAALIKYNRSKNYPKKFSEAGYIPKVAVYTCIFGPYESIKKIRCKSKYCDYWIITDQTVPEESGWSKLNIEFAEEISDASPTVKNRYCKMHPHVLFPEYEYSIYLDGSKIIYADIFPLLGRLGSHFIGMFRHGVRDCIYDEAETVIRVNRAPEDIVNLQMKKYEDEQFPRHYGLTEGCIIVREHNNKTCIKLMEDWWQIFLDYSKRDQLGLMYVMWKNGLKYEDIAVLGLRYEDDARIASREHGE